MNALTSTANGGAGDDVIVGGANIVSTFGGYDQRGTFSTQVNVGGVPWGNDIVRFYGPVTANNFFVNSCESGIYNTLTLNNGGNAVIQNGGELGLENAEPTSTAADIISSRAARRESPACSA